ncbi:MAG: peptidase M29 [Elusimicrobia bacterium RIFOXYB2_FULL_49_7]|nr:MAG: peptidase M29 [Elusimicrobia bacterium RIFOXYB2_FULL_49_7]
MLSKTEIEKYAEVLVWALTTARTKPYKKGDIIRISFEWEGLELAEAVFKQCITKGFQPVIRFVETAGMERHFYKKSCLEQLQFIAPGTKELNEKLNGSIFIMAPSSLTHLKEVAPSKITTAMVARKPFRDILWRREDEGSFGWTLCSLPTQALAQAAGLSLKTYTEQIRKACFLDKNDPIGEWKRVFKVGTAIRKRLNSMKIKTLTMEAATWSLQVSLGEQRLWLGQSGHNIPSFEIFTSPDWRGTEGAYFSNLPSFRTGNIVRDVRIGFKKGQAFSVKAAQGEAFVRKMLKSDVGACRVGEFSLTDKRFSRISRFMADTLYDENFGGAYGNAHVALGSAYTNTYRGNPSKLSKKNKADLGYNDSSLHWDLVNTEKKAVTAKLSNGKSVLLYENGEFRI